MKRFSLGLLLGLLLLLQCGCTAASNPLVRAEATNVPGLSMELHAASASDSNTDQQTATLYFGYLDLPMLASETRVLTVRRDESNELAIVRALLEGPTAGHLELVRLFPENVQVEDVTARDGVLFVTFNAALLNEPPRGDAAAEAISRLPLQRKLAMQSLVASLTESYPYTNVQVMVSRDNGAQTSLRLNNSYFLNGDGGISDPLTRDESLLLTPQNTALCLLRAWQERDFDVLYSLTASYDGAQSRPVYDRFAEALDVAPALGEYSATGGSVAIDGANAVTTVQLSLSSEAQGALPIRYPLQLIRENGVWKVTYQALAGLMLR
ncbi:MAG: GerMN domain-containing protein [Clostridia bacterium]